MPSPTSPRTPGRGRNVRAGAAGATMVLAAAAVFVLAMTAGAAARTATLTTTTTAHLNGPSGHRTEPVVTNARGVTVYWLSGDSARHPECTAANGCFGFWPPVKLGAGQRLTKAASVKGTLGTWRRGGFTQVTLNGHPLYTFAQDGARRGVATGDGVQSFHGTWHVIAAGRAHSAASPASTGSASSGGGW